MKQFAVIGNPIKHSFSPMMHEANFYSLKIKASYKAIEVKDLSESIHELKKLNGFNVTVPFKEDIISYLDDIDDVAKKIGAVNTVKCVHGKLIGYNTDADGFFRSFKSFNLRTSASILIIGAGGAAKAVYFSLLLNGFNKLTVCNRTLTRAKEFCENAMTLEEAEKNINSFSCIINATSVGLKDNESPLSINNISSDCVVMDLIYNPQVTHLLEDARHHGCLTKNGLEMLLYQGAKAFQIWFDQQPNEFVMLKQLEEAIYVNR